LRPIRGGDEAIDGARNRATENDGRERLAERTQIVVRHPAGERESRFIKGARRRRARGDRTQVGRRIRVLANTFDDVCVRFSRSERHTHDVADEQF